MKQGIYALEHTVCCQYVILLFAFKHYYVHNMKTFHQMGCPHLTNNLTALMLLVCLLLPSTLQSEMRDISGLSPSVLFVPA